MTLLSQLSPDGHELPLPADERLRELGFSAWEAALASAPDAAQARAWSAEPRGRRLLSAIFGNYIENNLHNRPIF